MLSLDYSNLIDLIKVYKISGRTESTAFLHWFLVNIYRLEKMEVDNIICDYNLIDAPEILNTLSLVKPTSKLIDDRCKNHLKSF